MFPELIDRAAKVLGIAEHVSVKETAESIDPFVTVSYPPKAVQTRIPASAHSMIGMGFNIAELQG